MKKEFFKKVFTSFKDFATSYMVRIFEGEDDLVKNNYLLGEFKVSGFEPKKREEIIIEVIFIFIIIPLLLSKKEKMI